MTTIFKLLALRPSIFQFYFQLIFCFAALLLATGCNFTHNNDDKLQFEQDVSATDSAFTLSASSSEQSWNRQLDSMLQVAETAKQDTSLARLYFDIGEMYLNNDASKAKEYYLKLGTLSEKLDWNKGRYLHAAGYTEILNWEGLMDSSIIINQQDLELAKKERNEQQIAKISVNIGNCYNYKRWYETAIKYYNDALTIFEKQDDSIFLAHLYYLMGVVHGYMDMYDEDIMYCEKSLNILNENPNPVVRIAALNNYASALLSKQELDKAEQCLTEAQEICISLNNKYSLMSIYSNFGDLALRRYDLEKLDFYTSKSLELALEFGDMMGYCVGYRALGYSEMYKGNFKRSEEYTHEALKTAIDYDFQEEIMKCYNSLSELYIARHDFRNYRFYAQKGDSIEKELISEKTRLYAKEMQTKYETEKKELKIAVLEEEKRFVIWLGIAGATVLLLALTALFFRWRWTVQKKRVSEQQRQLAEQQIKQLEQEKQIVATQAVLDGETRERARLARDLHDGLGSMLTGAKLNLLEMKKGATLEYIDVIRFDKTLGLLDESVHEMRRIAHHLMPDSLSRFGLKPAVSDFCSDLPSVHFAYYGNESRLEPKLEVIIYRTINELVNNALKHAEADKIMVQIMQEADRIAFTVQDDGCGFNPSAVTQGMGLQNIRTRITSYNGILDIDSKVGEGTEINVEILL